MVVQKTRAQYSASVSGRIKDAETGEPLPGVHVFLVNTVLGTTTDNDGYYKISRIPSSVYELSASMIGYKTAVYAIELESEMTRQINIQLEPTTYVLEPVEVTGRMDRRWKRNLRRFEEQFIGTSRNANKTEIQNYYVLYFEELDRAGYFNATASEPLKIENQALGYKISYDLQVFKWHPALRRLIYKGPTFFEELVPQDDREEGNWQQNRDEAFVGSLQHLLWALVHNRLEEEGFALYWHVPAPGNSWRRTVTSRHESFRVSADSILNAIDGTTKYEMAFDGRIMVIHRRKEKILLFSTTVERVSWLELVDYYNNPVTVYVDGYYTPADAIIERGYMQTQRVADMLPRGYTLKYKVEQN